MSYEFCSSHHCIGCTLFEIESVTYDPNQVFNDDIGTRVARRPRINKTKVEGSVIESNLRKCNACQLIWYCTPQHQHLDWKRHREFCRSVQKLKSTCNIKSPLLINGQPQNKIEMNNTIFKLKYLLRCALGRRLSFYEEELTSFPVYCGFCFNIKAHKVCAHCQAMSYCSEEHAIADYDNHKEDCVLLRLTYCKFKLLPRVTATVPFFSRVPDLRKTNLLHAYQVLTQRQISEQSVTSYPEYLLYANASDYSCIATICYVMEYLQIKDIEKEKFLIFIVGATIEARLWFNKTHLRLFFLQNPNISFLTIHFIGKEFQTVSRLTYTMSFHGRLRRVEIRGYAISFQLYMKRYKRRPSLVVAFNCGFSEFAERGDINKDYSAIPDDTLYESDNDSLHFDELMTDVPRETVNDISDIINAAIDSKHSTVEPFSDIVADISGLAIEPTRSHTELSSTKSTSGIAINTANNNIKITKLNLKKVNTNKSTNNTRDKPKSTTSKTTSEIASTDVCENKNNEEEIIVGNPWVPAILEMVQLFGVPIMFTSYTEMEGEFDYGAVVNVAKSFYVPLHVDRFLTLHKNPFRDLRPIRQWNLHDSEEFFFRNGFVQALKTSIRI